MHGENDDLGLGAIRENLPGCIYPIQIRHSDVEQDQVRPQCFSKFDRLTPIACLATQFPSWMTFEHGANPSPHDFVVIRNQNSKSAHLPAPVEATSRTAGSYDAESEHRVYQGS